MNLEFAWARPRCESICNSRCSSRDAEMRQLREEPSSLYTFAPGSPVPGSSEIYAPLDSIRISQASADAGFHSFNHLAGTISRRSPTSKDSPARWLLVRTNQDGSHVLGAANFRLSLTTTPLPHQRTNSHLTNSNNGLNNVANRNSRLKLRLASTF